MNRNLMLIGFTNNYLNVRFVSFLSFRTIGWSLKMIVMFFFLTGLLSCKQTIRPYVQQLDQGWKLHATKFTPEIPVAVPGLVHTDLFSAGLIPDPFYGDNEKDLQWIGDESWTYSLKFLPEKQLFEYEKIQLIFEGLDTYAKVFLNEKEVLSADNMFRTYLLEVSDILKKDTNELKIEFTPVDSMNRLKASKLTYRLPEERAFSRKAPYQLGWDWGPAFATMGIWKPVSLLGWNRAKLKNPAVSTLEINEDFASLELMADVDASREQLVELVIYEHSKLLHKAQFQLNQGENHLRMKFEVEKPRLWWPSGLGNQVLYNFQVHLVDGDQLLDQQKIVSGIRQIELIQEADEIGESFFFRVNGKDVFIKGANYIPEDHFPVRYERDKIKQLLTDAAEVHMNMIRVWGGGLYPNHDFYEICDSLGLMVWQDFMFACTVYPSDEDFLKNVKHEAEDQVKRLRKHPSLALWCGNNEVSEGFHNWGWQNDLGWSDSINSELWKGYKILFESVLPEVVAKNDPTKPYWPSSPSTGWGRPESLELGDVHYWGVWWGEEPFEMYQKKVGRFHSEYGFQSMPSLTSIQRFVDQDQLTLHTPMLEAHQKHPRGTQLIQSYMQRDFPVPENLDDYIYMSQLVQAHGIIMAVEAHRMNKPITMGTLYWQLNDSWPVISWSSIDYFGNWKALHFKLKHAFAPVLLAVEQKHDNLRIKGVNDSEQGMQLRLELDLKDFEGNILSSYSEPVYLDVKEAVLLKDLNINTLLSSSAPDQVFLHGKLFDETEEKAELLHFFVQPKDLRLQNQTPELVWENVGGVLEISLKSKYLIKSLMLISNDEDGRFEENFLDLIPGKPYTVRFHPSGNLELDQLRFEYKCLNQFLFDNPL